MFGRLTSGLLAILAMASSAVSGVWRGPSSRHVAAQRAAASPALFGGPYAPGCPCGVWFRRSARKAARHFARVHGRRKGA